MKKLIIAACAVAFATVSQAAALSWSTWAYTNDGSSDSDWISGGQAYLVMVTDTSAFAVDESLNVTGGTIVDNTVLGDGTAAGMWNGTGDLVDGTTYYFAIIATTDGAGSSVPTTGFYAVDMNGDTGTASGFYEVTWSTATGGSLDADGEFAGAAMTSAVGGEPIPEPTSGLMLLLGVAGLALRRKQK